MEALTIKNKIFYHHCLSQFYSNLIYYRSKSLISQTHSVPNSLFANIGFLLTFVNVKTMEDMHGNRMPIYRYHVINVVRGIDTL